MYNYHTTQLLYSCTFIEELEIHAGTKTYRFRAALFLIVHNGEVSRCPSSGEWLNNLWHIHTMEYYLEIKLNNYQYT